MSEKTIRFLVGSVSDNLREKFKVDDNGLWYNERLEFESEKRSKFAESRRQNGAKGGRPKKTNKPSAKPKKNLKDNHMDNHMGNENENENVIDNERGKLKIEIQKLGQDFAEAWDRWKSYRKKKDGFTYHDQKSERSAISKLGNLAGGKPEKAIEIIENSIDNGWKGFFLTEEQKNGTNGKQNSKGWAAPTVADVIEYQRNKHGSSIQ